MGGKENGALSLGAYSLPLNMKPTAACHRHVHDVAYVRRAVLIADKSAGFTSTHPNFGCVIATPSGDVAGEGYLYAQGRKLAEIQAVEAGGEHCRGASAYLNMEPGDCHSDDTAVSALVQAGIQRVVVGISHPLQHLRGNSIRALRGPGLHVEVLEEDIQSQIVEEAQEAQKSCLLVNLPLIHRAISRVPFYVLILKYAITLDGKIAAGSGHAAWISSKLYRNRVFELRGRSNASIVGGNTVCRDSKHGDGHMPIQIVMTQTIDLPEEANLWDMSEVSTIVVTQRGARRSFQKLLASKGVEVVEFDILNPREVMEYFHDWGYLSILWECGGTLAASAISSGAIHKKDSSLSFKNKKMADCCLSCGTRIKTRKQNVAAPLDPAAFADAVVQIYLDNAGDLELVCKNLESSGLNFSRYGYTFFEASFLFLYGTLTFRYLPF
ncbi:hypothetical protein SLEP1_g47838 [Rubroshorea leprosula]|uniref:CMP/dCMP-type deaminase domain-containing protein n=1 Tax=Rubroshorea leprosula TaxID=152421 RepID=A0AAV5LSR3_9ROSI|nr:hypothetical protein SLEP1_g47838 [Rubroshorea leprosula]